MTDLDFEQFIRMCERTAPSLPVTVAVSLFTAITGAASAGPRASEAVDRELRAGRRIQAIKEYRVETGAGLKSRYRCSERPDPGEPQHL